MASPTVSPTEAKMIANNTILDHKLYNLKYLNNYFDHPYGTSGM